MKKENSIDQDIKKRNHGKITILIVIIFIFIALSFEFFFTAKSIIKNISGHHSLVSQLSASSRKIKGENEKRTNILLLGMAGQNYEGAELTDSIMIVSIYHQDNNKKIALISLPRDLYINLKNYGNLKINNLYTLDAKNTNQEQKNILISKAISDITGLPIHYYVKVDFEGFKKVVDTLNGIDINIERSFYDSMYPTDDYGYETIKFDKGWTHMDGETALKYARSRHGIVIDDSNGYEASDFARAKRQQQILFAAKDKIISLNTILNPKKINELLTILGNHVTTNLQFWELLRLADSAKNLRTTEIKNNVIDDSPNGLLYSSTAPDNSFIVLPKSNNFYEIQQFCENIFRNKEDQKEQTNLQILNGTTFPGLTAQITATIPFENINIININNADKQNYKKTIIFDYSKNTKNQTVEFLKNRLNAKVIKADNKPEEFQKFETQPDITLIIGQNFLQLPRYEY